MIDKTKIKDGMVIHCPTGENARELMEVLEELRYAWSCNIPPTSETNWLHGENTCYYVQRTPWLQFGDIAFARESGERIIELKDLLRNTPPSNETNNLTTLAICNACLHKPLCFKVPFLELFRDAIGTDGRCPHYIADTSRSEDIKRIAVHYGRQAQMVKCVEELNELAVALLHDDYPNIVEEIADVEVTITQVKHLLGIPDATVSEIKQSKIERTLERIYRQEGLNDSTRSETVSRPLQGGARP